jgi:hypothetical protein
LEIFQKSNIFIEEKFEDTGKQNKIVKTTTTNIAFIVLGYTLFWSPKLNAVVSFLLDMLLLDRKPQIPEKLNYCLLP